MASVSGFRRRCSMNFIEWRFVKKIYSTLDEVQADLDAWLKHYNEQRPRQGQWCYGKTAMPSVSRQHLN